MAAEPVSLARRRTAAARAARAEPASPPPRAGEGYSRFVTMMKITLPLIAAVLVGLVVVWPQFRDVREGFRIEIARLTHSLGTQEVSNARFTGTDARGRPYTVIADSAAQVEGQPDLIGLAHPKADVTMQGGAWVASSADAGRFNRIDQLLDLTGGVSLFHDQGFEIHSPSARLDLKSGTAEGNEKVDGHGPTGTISAEGFRVLDNGARVFFTGPARLVMSPDPRTPGR